MSKRYKHAPVNLSDFKDKAEREGCIPVVTDSGTFYIRPPHLLSDDEYRTFLATDDADHVAQARILLGEDKYEAFVEAGGSAMIVGAILAEAIEAEQAEQGASSGESEASSIS